MSELNFLGLTNIALRLVREQYPQAELFEAEGRSSTGPTTNVEEINHWQFVFKAGEVGTAFIRTTAWGEFGPVTYSKYSWGDDVVIPWPINMEITEAAQLKQQAGYNQPYGAVTLRWPLGFQINEPFYIFGQLNEQLVEVGVYDKVVKPLS
jgi:hypothetical protein